jgi:hypothetical protein
MRERSMAEGLAARVAKTSASPGNPARSGPLPAAPKDDPMNHPMTHAPRLLDQIQIASPCSADWNAMQGDERRRFCEQCKLHVHNLSAMTRDEAEALLLSAASGRVCTRFFRRADGTVLTRDCPVGVRARLRRTWARACALASALFVFAGCQRRAVELATALPIPTVEPRPVMGDVASPREVKGEASLAPQPQPQPQQGTPHEFMGRLKTPPQSDK